MTIAVLALGVVAGAAPGCGQSPREARQERERAAEQQRLSEKAAELEDGIRELKAQQAAAITTTGEQQARAPERGPSRDCGGGVAAGPGTSCDFALNTAREWVDTSGGQAIQVFSPATRKAYAMKCRTDASLTVCRGGRGATVYIP